jgi:hypothetical protein
VKELNLEVKNMEESTTDKMETASESLMDSVAEGGKSALQAVDEGLGALGRGTKNLLHALPGHGTIPGFAVGLGAAMLVGVAELAAACFTAYISYRMFSYGESLSEAIEKAIKFESGKLDENEIDKPIPEHI